MHWLSPSEALQGAEVVARNRGLDSEIEIATGVSNVPFVQKAGESDETAYAYDHAR